jgi:molecular chaperone DnaK
MILEAEQNAEADKLRKERVEKRNNLDTLRIQAEKTVTESEAAPQDLKDKVTALADEARNAVQTDADDAKIAQLQTDLETALRELMQAAPPAAEGESQAAPKDDDVIDADFKPAS